MKHWFQLATGRDVVIRSLKVSGIVGVVLVAINQGDLMFIGELPVDFFWKIPMTFGVPYCVSTYASVSALLKHESSL